MTEKNSTPAVAIVGGGAVGKMLAYFLQSASIPVIIYGRQGPQSQRLTIQIHGRTHQLSTPALEGRPGQDQGLTVSPSLSSQLWLFATKAYDLTAALEQWLPTIDPAIPLVILCNGYIEPSLSALRLKFPRHTLRKGVVSRGARTLADGTLALSDKGEIIWGGPQNATPLEDKIFRELEPEGFTWSENVCRLRKEKWFCNTVLNTLSGAYRLPRNADALQQPEYAALCHEVFRLGLSYWPEWQGQEQILRNQLDGLIAKTQDNENSMAADVRLGRQTEAEFLSGHIASVNDFQNRFPILARLHARIVASR